MKSLRYKISYWIRQVSGVARDVLSEVDPWHSLAFMRQSASRRRPEFLAPLCPEFGKQCGKHLDVFRKGLWTPQFGCRSVGAPNGLAFNPGPTAMPLIQRDPASPTDPHLFGGTDEHSQQRFDVAVTGLATRKELIPNAVPLLFSEEQQTPRTCGQDHNLTGQVGIGKLQPVSPDGLYPETRAHCRCGMIAIAVSIAHISCAW